MQKKISFFFYIIYFINNYQIKLNFINYVFKLQARERELQLLQEEKRKREELERQLNEEKHLREKISQENIKLRDKKQNQVGFQLIQFNYTQSMAKQRLS